MSEELKKCAACRTEKPVKQMKVCMHSQMHYYVCDSKCMHNFYNPPKKPAAPTAQEYEAIKAERDQLLAELAALRPAHPAPDDEAVEVVAYRVSLPSEPELGHWLDEHAESEPQMCQHEPLMTVAQHNRIMAATVPAGSRVVPVELLQDLCDLASDAVEDHRQAFAGYKLERQATMDETIKAGRALLEVKP